MNRIEIPLCCSPNTLSGMYITSFSSVFNNPLPQRNQIGWQKYHDYQGPPPPYDCQFHRKRCALQKFESHCHYPGNAWDNENANLMLISQVKFELEKARVMNILESP